MTKNILRSLSVLFSILLTPLALADQAGMTLSKEDAIEIISTMDRLSPSNYKIVHISDGTLREKSGFQHTHAKKISFLGPQNGRNTSRSLRHCTLLYSPEYGWYLQHEDRDARGAFLEISSQKLGRVFVR